MELDKGQILQTVFVSPKVCVVGKGFRDEVRCEPSMGSEAHVGAESAGDNQLGVITDQRRMLEG